MVELPTDHTLLSWLDYATETSRSNVCYLRALIIIHFQKYQVWTHAVLLFLEHLFFSTLYFMMDGNTERLGSGFRKEDLEKTIDSKQGLAWITGLVAEHSLDIICVEHTLDIICRSTMVCGSFECTTEMMKMALPLRSHVSYIIIIFVTVTFLILT